MGGRVATNRKKLQKLIIEMRYAAMLVDTGIDVEYGAKLWFVRRVNVLSYGCKKLNKKAMKNRVSIRQTLKKSVNNRKAA